MPAAVDWLARRAQLTPRKTALIDADTGRTIDYRTWNAHANQTAHYLHQLGIAKGDRVAILSTNNQAYLDTWFACAKTGAILQNLNWRLAIPELQALITDAEPRLLLYSAEFTDTVQALHRDCPTITHWIALDQPAHPHDRHLGERTAYPTTNFDRPALTHDDPWLICYTGGTTGLPKGAILTHGNILWNAINTTTSWNLAPTDMAILNAPLFHTGGLNVFTAPLVHIGATSILCRNFDPEQVFDLIERHPVTLFFGVPTMFIMLQQHPRWPTADFSRLKLVISGGAPCPRPVFDKFWAKNVDFKTGYGLTEAGPNTFWLPPQDVQRKPGAVGFPLFHVEVKLIDPDGADITAPDQAGELLIRGPHRFPGYWNNPEATRQAITPDGWLRTGDLAQRDAEGYYTICGRVKDMIISGGENIYPAEVESIIFGHPAVAEVAVIGIPDAQWGEVGRAYIVLHPNTTLPETDLLDYLRPRLARYKIPKTITFVAELPKTGAGKIDKKRLSQTE